MGTLLNSPKEIFNSSNKFKIFELLIIIINYMGMKNSHSNPETPPFDTPDVQFGT